MKITIIIEIYPECREDFSGDGFPTLFSFVFEYIF